MVYPADLLISCLLGILFGTFTGLIPGVHVNNLAVWTLVLSISLPGLDPLLLAVFLVSAAVTHSFVDFIPSIFFAAPEDSTALAVLPGHRFLLKGYGVEALMLTAYSGVFALLISILMLPIMMKLIPVIYLSAKKFIPCLLLATLLFMISLERNKGKAALIVALSSLLGIVAFQLNLSAVQVFTSMLTGLFGISVMVISYKANTKIPKQRKVTGLEIKKLLQGSVLGVVGGIMAGVLPALGTAQSTIIVTRLSRVKSNRVFISTIGAMNTIASVFSVLSIYLIGYARSGVAVALDQIIRIASTKQVMFFTLLSMLAGCAAAFITIKLGRLAAVRLERATSKKLILSVMFFLVMFVYYLSSILGVLLMIASTILGLLPHRYHVKKSLLMSSLMVPTMLIYLGA